MANNEDVSIIHIDTSPASLSIKDLKTNVSLLKKELEGLEIGSEEYQHTLSELKTNQNALKDAMYATSASLEQVIEGATGASESYNSLVHRMAALKEELRNTDISNEAGYKRFKQLAGQVNDINNQLKKLDAAQGNYQRNVGMYNAKIAEMGNAFRATAGAAGSMVTPIANATMGLQAMSATPVVAILGLLANVISSVVRELKSSEENMNAARLEMSAFSGVATLFKNLMQTLGTAVSFVVKQMNNLALKVFPKLREQAEKQNAITQATIDLSFKQREAIEKNADAELAIAKLREKAVDKENYSAEERIAFLEKANALELEISRRSKEIAEKEYEIALMNSELAKNSKEENDALAEAYAKKVKAETDYYKKSKETTAAIVAAKKEERREAEKALAEETRAHIAMLNNNRQYWAERINHVAKGSDEEFQIRMQILEDEKNAELEATKVNIKRVEERVDAQMAIRKKYQEKMMALLEEYADAQQDYERQNIQTDIAILEQGSIARMRKEEELALFELNFIKNKGKLETETEEQYQNRLSIAEDEYSDRKRARLNAEKQMYREYAATIGDIFSSIADIYEGDEKLASKNAVKIKALRIAQATIDTISGAVGAFMGITKDTGGWGIAQATLQAAAVTAAGIAQIQKIRNTKVGSTDGGTSSTSSAPASVTPPSVNANVQSVRYLTSASEEERLNAMTGDQRVVLVMSDLEVKQNQMRVQTAEASF